ncbi:unnamed protein product [Lactuca virosa]|uniref:Retrotransposon gag domain-containing protein n=1 Tax=Lactuca virosa TaxID=75947 RepID=A0AAU9PEZ9_9ASTR|nr:unnamed protein product [Lactuca virosa]
MGRSEYRGDSRRGRGSNRGRGSDRGRGQGRGGDRGSGKGKQSHVVTSGKCNKTQSSPSPSGCNKETQSSHGSGGSRIQSSHVVGLTDLNILQTIPDHQDYDSYGDDDEYGEEGDDGADGEEGDDGADDDIIGRGSNVADTPPTNPAHREFIERTDQGFSDPAVHRQITLIIRMFYTTHWTTWSEVDSVTHERMFARFKSLYQWPESEDAKIHEGFLNILKQNFRELMRTARKRAAKAAR